MKATGRRHSESVPSLELPQELPSRRAPLEMSKRAPFNASRFEGGESVKDGFCMQNIEPSELDAVTSVFDGTW